MIYSKVILDNKTILNFLTFSMTLLLASACTIDTTSTYHKRSYSTLKINGKKVRDERYTEKGGGTKKTVVSLESEKEAKEPRKSDGQSAKSRSKNNSGKTASRSIPKLDQEAKQTKANGGEYTTTTAVNLRSEPDSDSSKIFTVKKDKTILFTGRKEGVWWQVKVNGRKGWMSSKFLKKKDKSFGDRLKSLF